jgi:hypothetical protein
MRNLPSETKKLVGEKVCEITNLKDGEIAYIAQPCDCGSHIRHNNGGNYHETVAITRDGNVLFMKVESSCELSAPAEWEKLETPVRDIVERYSEWL